MRRHRACATGLAAPRGEATSDRPFPPGCRAFLHRSGTDEVRGGAAPRAAAAQRTRACPEFHRQRRARGGLLGVCDAVVRRQNGGAQLRDRLRRHAAVHSRAAQSVRLPGALRALCRATHSPARARLLLRRHRVQRPRLRGIPAAGAPSRARPRFSAAPGDRRLLRGLHRRLRRLRPPGRRPHRGAAPGLGGGGERHIRGREDPSAGRGGRADALRGDSDLVGRGPGRGSPRGQRLPAAPRCAPPRAGSTGGKAPAPPGGIRDRRLPRLTVPDGRVQPGSPAGAEHTGPGAERPLLARLDHRLRPLPAGDQHGQLAHGGGRPRPGTADDPRVPRAQALGTVDDGVRGGHHRRRAGAPGLLRARICRRRHDAAAIAGAVGGPEPRHEPGRRRGAHAAAAADGRRSAAGHVLAGTGPGRSPAAEARAGRRRGCLAGGPVADRRLPPHPAEAVAAADVTGGNHRPAPRPAHTAGTRCGRHPRAPGGERPRPLRPHARLTQGEAPWLVQKSPW